MPYHIRKVKKGFKVQVHGRYLSKRPLSLNRARRQRVAVILSEQRRANHSPYLQRDSFSFGQPHIGGFKFKNKAGHVIRNRPLTKDEKQVLSRGIGVGIHLEKKRQGIKGARPHLVQNNATPQRRIKGIVRSAAFRNLLSQQKKLLTRHHISPFSAPHHISHPSTPGPVTPRKDESPFPATPPRRRIPSYADYLTPQSVSSHVETPFKTPKRPIRYNSQGEATPYSDESPSPWSTGRYKREGYGQCMSAPKPKPKPQVPEPRYRAPSWPMIFSPIRR